MTLEDALWIIPDNQTVKVYDATFTRVVAFYDGKSGIPESLYSAVVENIVAIDKNVVAIVTNIC